MKLLVKFEIKFLNFFTLKNLNNKKMYFFITKKYCLYVSKQNYKLQFSSCAQNKYEITQQNSVFLKHKTLHTCYTPIQIAKKPPFLLR